MGKQQKIGCIAFTDRGQALAEKIARALGAEAARSGRPRSVHRWTEENFGKLDALIYVGAAGIAVRAIAPFVKDKQTDPAVVVIDERALHVIPLLSGHLGGANDLARRIAQITGSDCVITTATDVNGVFAVDEWSKHQSCVLLEKEKIMHISSTLLAGGRISVYSQWPVRGEVPEGIDLISPQVIPYAYDAEEEAEGAAGFSTNDIDVSLDIEVVGRHPLHLVPRICVLGIGCRRGTSQQAIEEMLFDVLELTCVHPAAITAVASIDLKKDEPGLTSFCAEHGWPLLTYSSEQLQQVKGDFTPSAFVASITGVDNVCERSAVLASGGTLIQGKVASGGVTMAMAQMNYEPDWTWRSEENE
ncbi:MAG: cobalamin biosynthesis protein [Firmicutes bacterium]|nr:cobalamin biosynthesis protein [Bacillota bacterium]